MWNTHNVIGITEDTSGNEFLDTAIMQLEEYGIKYYQDRVKNIRVAEDSDRRFLV